MLVDKNVSEVVNVPNQVDDVDILTTEKRKAYIKPRLEKLGDLRTLTLGITQGINESGPFSPNHW